MNIINVITCVAMLYSYIGSAVDRLCFSGAPQIRHSEDFDRSFLGLIMSDYPWDRRNKLRHISYAKFLLIA